MTKKHKSDFGSETGGAGACPRKRINAERYLSSFGNSSFNTLGA
nr:MAG TPA: hypothetical protein [Caudoviricetes sp.]